MKVLHCFFGQILWILMVNAEYQYETNYLNVLLDHFAFAYPMTFPLKYLINDAYCNSPNDCPIFFYAGNEGKIEDFVESTGFLWEAAERFGAIVCFCEHRYYGESMPFGYISFDDTTRYGYLNVEQAMADFVDLIYYLKNEYKDWNCGGQKARRTNPVVIFGGSYAGELATLMRIKYPGVVQGALASSAPLLMFIEGKTTCDGFLRRLTETFAKSNTKCVDNIRKSWKALRNIMVDNYGKKYISTTWNLCDHVRTSDDIQGLLNYIRFALASLGMANYPYSTNFMGPMAAHPVDVMCKVLDKNFGSDMDLATALYKAISTYVNYTEKVECYHGIGGDHSVDVGIDNMGGVAWDAQTCTQLVEPMCSNGITDMFEPVEYNPESYAEKCYQAGFSPTKFGYLQYQYGLDDLRALTNIIFSQGNLDPWAFGGLTKADVPLATVVELDDAAHHLDLRPSNPADPPSVTQARIQYLHLFKTWIQDYRKFRSIPRNDYDTYLDSLQF